MRIKYDEESLKKIKDLVSEHKTNDEICDEFGVESGYRTLCEKCGSLRKELGIKLDYKRKTGKYSAMSGLSKVLSAENTSEVEDNVSTASSESCGKSFGGVVDTSSITTSLTGSITNLEHAICSFNSEISSKLLGGFTPKELMCMEIYSKSIGTVIAKLEYIQFMMDNISEIRKE